jgi:SnoaL-like domain
MQITEACDRMEIAALIDDFAIRLDRALGGFPFHFSAAETERVLDLFAPDGILHTPFGRAEGKEAIRDVWSHIATLDVPDGAPKYIRHFMTSREVVLVDENTAHATSYVQGVSDSGVDHWGQYEDRLIKLDDGWKFAERLVIVHDWIPEGYYARLPNPQNPTRTW